MEALGNFDELVREWTCNRETRMALEASVLCLQDVIEDRDKQTARVAELEARVAELEGGDAGAGDGDSKAAE